MNRFFTLLLAASCLTAVGQVPDYVPTDGLLGWWPLGEVSSDQSGNQLDGELIETVHTDGFNGLANSATYFNGENSCYVVEGPIPLQGDFTFSFWIRSIIGITDFNPIMILNGGSGCSINSNLEVYMGNGGLTVASNRGTEDFSFYYYNEIAHLEWTHITLTLTGSQMALYTNGILSQIGPIQPFVGEPQPMRIGHFNSAAFDGCDIFFEGSIDDVGFWDEALSNEQIQELFLAPVHGCTNEVACNFAPSANEDDGGCEFVSCHCLDGTVWSAELEGCIVANPSDSNFDGCVQLNDLLDLLSAYGNCGAEESAWQCGDPLEYQGYDYETVQIGEQCWFAENLRAENYRNGDAIPGGLSNDAWSSTMSGARAVYADGGNLGGQGAECVSIFTSLDVCVGDIALGVYGRLYNWYAVTDVRHLCPLNWQVPDLENWSQLEEYVGSDSAGVHLKSISDWYEFGPNWNLETISGEDTYGFRALPSGGRGSSGTTYDAGNATSFWTSTFNDNGSNSAFRKALVSASAQLNGGSQLLNVGNAVRCIKDSE